MIEPAYRHENEQNQHISCSVSSCSSKNIYSLLNIEFILNTVFLYK
jgi:hypothetical protein